MKEALYYEKLDNGRVRCLLCPHRCMLPPGRTGFCRVRRNRGGTLYSLNYSCAASVALDPIEKKPLYHFHPGSLILSAGTFGCNFKCSWCQNWTIAHGDDRIAASGDKAVSATRQNKEGTGNETAPEFDNTGSDCESQDDPDLGGISASSYDWRNAVELTPEGLAGLATEYARMGSIGVAYTYNEPTVWYEFVLETSRLVKEQGLVNVLVTNGFIAAEPLNELLEYTDAMNIDVKAFTEEFYNRYCKGSLEDVKKTVELAAHRCHVEITTLIIPGLNDSPEETGRLAEWLSGIDPDIVLHLTRFFPGYHLTDIGPTPRSTLEKARESALLHLKYVYLGNV